MYFESLQYVQKSMSCTLFAEITRWSVGSLLFLGCDLGKERDGEGRALSRRLFPFLVD